VTPQQRAALRTIDALKKSLRKLPITASARIASRAAPAMSSLAGGSYDAGQTVYGRPRPLSVDGKPLDLHRTGASRRAMNFIPTGRDIRTARLPEYTRYLIGRYSVLPNGPLPVAWRERLTQIAAEVLYEQIHSTRSVG
jgi:hypothetical protein